MSSHVAKIYWRRKSEEAFADGRFSRAHNWAFDGGAVVAASASPQMVAPPFADPTGVDPEEALVAALSSCHMLFFLEFARQRGFRVESYVDNAEGVMANGANAPLRMTTVTLRPNAVFSGDKRPSEADVEALHRDAHSASFVSNSLMSEVAIESVSRGIARA